MMAIFLSLCIAFPATCCFLLVVGYLMYIHDVKKTAPK